jgi:hypothetical protein
VPSPKLGPVELSDDERRTLSGWARRRKTAQALALRSRIVLRCAEGGTIGAGACPDRTRAIPCKVRAVTGKVPITEDRSRPAKTVAETVAMTADNACSMRTTLECRPSTETAMDGPGRCAHSYGSEAHSKPRGQRSRHGHSVSPIGCQQ